MKLFTHNLGKARLAFTLIDVVVGMGVLGIVMISLFASFTFGFSVVKTSQEELQATQVLQEKMETIRLYNWDQLTNPTNAIFIGNQRQFAKPLEIGGSNFFAGEVIVTNAPLGGNPAYAADMRQVIVTVTWTNNHIKRSRSVSTFVSRDGLQNYLLN
jgi:type II secretory pathway pseudopilin PulG